MNSFYRSYFLMTVCGIGVFVHGDHRHGPVKMGVSNDFCDNGKLHLEVDLPDITLYECKGPRLKSQIKGRRHYTSWINCSRREHQPLHECMTTKITYEDTVPTSGPHRPLWPVYGEYYALPPQRWIHSLEHGAAVFLYHPCADPGQVDLLRYIARSCMKRHIITPYYNLTESQPFAIATWTCLMTMGGIDVANIRRARQFIRRTAKRTDESGVYQDGQYDYLLVNKASMVTDKYDTVLCPTINYPGL